MLPVVAFVFAEREDGVGGGWVRQVSESRVAEFVDSGALAQPPSAVVRSCATPPTMNKAITMPAISVLLRRT